MAHWLEQRHPQYGELSIRNTFAEDHFSGNALEKARKYAERLEQFTGQAPLPSSKKGGVTDLASWMANKTGTTDSRSIYLVRRAQGEAIPNYQERARISRFPRIMSFIVGSMAGSLAQVENKAIREWGPLGDPDDTDGFLAQFLNDIDGRGTNLDSWQSDITGRLQIYDALWLYVEPPANETDKPRFLLWHPNDVVNWHYSGTNLEWVVVREYVDTRSDPKRIYGEDETAEENYILYTAEGWERWRFDGDDDATLLEEGRWQQSFVGQDNRPRLPVIHKSLFQTTHSGYELAKDANYLYNLLSDSRNIVRIANHPRLRGAAITPEEFNTTMEQMQQGSNVLMGDWQYISPDASNFERAYKYYVDEVLGVARDAYHRMNDAAAQRTATEMRQEDQAGRSSYLTLLSRTLDEIENEAFYLLNQIMSPRDARLWSETFIERSRDFKPVDPEAEARTIVDTLMPLWTDLPDAFRQEVVTMLADRLNVPVDEEVLRADAEEGELLRAQERAELEALRAEA